MRMHRSALFPLSPVVGADIPVTDPRRACTASSAAGEVREPAAAANTATAPAESLAFKLKAPIRRMPLRRMPTELVLTTRMRPVKLESVEEPPRPTSPQSSVSTDIRPIQSFQSPAVSGGPWSAAADVSQQQLTEQSPTTRLAVVAPRDASTVAPRDASTARPSSGVRPVRVTSGEAVTRDIRPHAPRLPTELVQTTEWRSSADAVLTRELKPRRPRWPTELVRTTRIPVVKPELDPVSAAKPMMPSVDTPMMPSVDTRPRAHVASHGAQRPACTSPGDNEVMARMRQQLASTYEKMRQLEARAVHAEMQLRWHEKLAPGSYVNLGLLDGRAVRDKRMRQLKTMLQLCLAGVALGGYMSLLLPVREHVVAQDARIRQLTEQQEQLRRDKRELISRVEGLSAERGAEVATSPAETAARRR